MSRMTNPGAAARREPRYTDAGALAAEYADDLIVGTTRDMHQVIARRAFDATNALTGGSAAVPQAVHNGISGAVYSSVSAGLQIAAAGLRVAGEHGVGKKLADGPGGRTIVSAVNGFIGDRLLDDQHDMAIRMSVRAGGVDVPLWANTVREAFPDATDSIVVFVHGLLENEEHWSYKRAERGGSYGERLAVETDWTPVFVRANTGLPIAENGVALSSLLDSLVEAWPYRPRRIALVGHSMGGLIIRAACSVQSDSHTPWNRLVSNVVTLGAPHLGAPLAKGANWAARLFRRVPETTGFGRILDTRSQGIVDLERALARNVQNLPHARYHLVAATLTRAAGSPIGAVLGDLLVRLPSALGRPRRGVGLFPEADELHLPVSHHFDLLNHPDVYTALRYWLQ